VEVNVVNFCDEAIRPKLYQIRTLIEIVEKHCETAEIKEPDKFISRRRTLNALRKEFDNYCETELIPYGQRLAVEICSTAYRMNIHRDLVVKVIVFEEGRNIFEFNNTSGKNFRLQNDLLIAVKRTSLYPDHLVHPNKEIINSIWHELSTLLPLDEETI
jgi:hypothetical protein